MMNQHFKMIKHLTLLLFIGLAWGQTTIAVFEFENNGLEPFEVRQLSEDSVYKDGNFVSRKIY